MSTSGRAGLGLAPLFIEPPSFLKEKEIYINHRALNQDTGPNE